MQIGNKISVRYYGQVEHAASVWLTTILRKEGAIGGSGLDVVGIHPAIIGWKSNKSLELTAWASSSTAAAALVNWELILCAGRQLNSMLSAGSIAKESELKGEELGDVGEETQE